LSALKYAPDYNSEKQNQTSKQANKQQQQKTLTKQKPQTNTNCTNQNILLGTKG
jgi:hypothetical protein